MPEPFPRPQPVTGYRYIERLVAPRIVEFYTRTSVGHRVVRICLDTTNTRITAFNESESQRSPATLFLEELLSLIERANELTTPIPKDQSND